MIATPTTPEGTPTKREWLSLNVQPIGIEALGFAVGAFLSGAAARHLAARFGSPGTMLTGRGLEVAGVLTRTIGFIGALRLRRGSVVTAITPSA